MLHWLRIAVDIQGREIHLTVNSHKADIPGDQINIKNMINNNKNQSNMFGREFKNPSVTERSWD